MDNSDFMALSPIWLIKQGAPDEASKVGIIWRTTYDAWRKARDETANLKLVDGIGMSDFGEKSAKCCGSGAPKLNV